MDIFRKTDECWISGIDISGHSVDPGNMDWSQSPDHWFASVEGTCCYCCTTALQLYSASPAWSGFIKADETAKMQSVLNKAVCYGFLTNYKPIEYLFESSDTTLFSAILRRPGHVLHPLLPPLKTTGYHLRKRSHGLKLSAVQSSLLRRNFIYRMLYTDIYWICLFYHTVYFWTCYILFTIIFVF